MSDATRDAWDQRIIPVIYRPKSGQLIVRVPFAVGNRGLIRGDCRGQPKWDKWDRQWRTPRAWMDRLVRSLVESHGKVWLIQAHSIRVVCAPACWRAKHLDCDCSCGGARHGSENQDGMHIISDSLAVGSEDGETTAQLFTRKVTP